MADPYVLVFRSKHSIKLVLSHEPNPLFWKIFNFDIFGVEGLSKASPKTSTFHGFRPFSPFWLIRFTFIPFTIRSLHLLQVHCIYYHFIAFTISSLHSLSVHCIYYQFIAFTISPLQVITGPYKSLLVIFYYCFIYFFQ